MTGDTPSGRPTPRWVKVLAAVAGAVAVVAAGVVYAVGGFGQRSDWLVRSAGEEVDAGNLVFTLVSATAQRDDSPLGGGRWTVLASGSVRNPHDTSLAPLTRAQGNLFARDHAGGTVADLSTVELGEHYSRTEVPPDDRPMALVAQFTFDRFEPGRALEVAVATMEFTDNSILGLGGGAKEWNTDSSALLQIVSVPLTVLPPKTG